MLFNSHEFIFVFLPVTLVGFFLIGRFGHYRAAIGWLVGASLFFYGWWNPAYLGLIVASILINYSIGRTLITAQAAARRKLVLIAGVGINLAILAYFKYANFFADNIDSFFGTGIHLEAIVLPLAISFFTFQQIAYLVDAYKGIAAERDFLRYCLFVTFFPQLIAGPIVHHKEMLPQFVRDRIYKARSLNIAIGVSIFAIGLFKKVIIADGIARYATPVFAAADAGVPVTFFEAWIGVLAYSFQIYFDFSGYSDMAIGLGRLFGIRLPLNFNSPYRARNIIDFWRRWHITLSRFLRDYLYVPLGGNRKGRGRRYANLMTTMLLGGLWHGAGWNFIIWGGLHGFYLTINHLWHAVRPVKATASRLGRVLSWALTFFAVTIAWIPFRAETTVGTKAMWSGIAGLNGVSLPTNLAGSLGFLDNVAARYDVAFNGLSPLLSIPRESIVYLATLVVAVVVLPNTQQFMRNYRPAFETYHGEVRRMRYRVAEWRPTVAFGVFIGILMFFVLKAMSSVEDSEFLYFNF